MFDALGDRMKEFESVETSRALDCTIPIYARVDGRGFSKFTKDMKRPFDPRMSFAMIDAAKYLVKETHAKLAFVQSDEISLVWSVESDNPLATVFFSGKVQKLASVLAGMATASLMHSVHNWGESGKKYLQRMPHFDARVINLPSKEEASNMFIWRERDATRNAVTMVAQTLYSHSQLQGVNTNTMREMIADKGVIYDNYPDYFRKGTFVRRQKIERLMTESEIKMNPKINTDKPTTIRTIISEMFIPSLVDIENRSDMIFDNADPIVRPPLVSGITNDGIISLAQ